MSSPAFTRAILWIAAGLAAVVLGVSASLLIFGAPNASNGRALPSGSITGTADIGGPFTLINQDGREVSQEILNGRVSMIYFGYTFCPDVCPTGLNSMGLAADILADKGKQVQTIFITVDPERDDAKTLKEYVAYFHPQMIGLGGAPEQVNAVRKVYRVYAAKAPVAEGEDPANYLVDHSSHIYVMGPDGALATLLSHNSTPEQIAKEVEKFL